MEEKNKDQRWCVYIHINKINNKKYVGITSRKPNERWGVDGKEYCRNNQPRFENAINEYGWDNFEHVIFAENLTQEDANNLEILLIALLKTNCCRYKNPEYGYNLTDGGGGISGHRDGEEARKRKSEASKIMWQKDGFRDKMIKIRTGKKRKPYSQEMKNKLSEIMKGKFPREKNPMCREVYSPELDIIFYSAIEAFDKYGVSPQGISNCCNGKQKTAGHHPETGEPLHWEYVDKTYIDINKANYNHKKGTDWWNCRPVNQYALDGSLIKRYNYILQAGEECNIDPSSIRKCCAGQYNQAGGFLWRYKDEYDEEYLDFKIPKRKTNGPIIQLDLKGNFIAEYLDVPELSSITGFDSSSIYKCLKGKMKSYHGYKFILKEDYNK